MKASTAEATAATQQERPDRRAPASQARTISSSRNRCGCPQWQRLTLNNLVQRERLENPPPANRLKKLKGTTVPLFLHRREPILAK